MDAFVGLSASMSGTDALAGAGLFALLLLSGLRACADWRKDARRGLLVGGLCVPCLLYALARQQRLLVGALPLCMACAPWGCVSILDGRASRGQPYY